MFQLLLLILNLQNECMKTMGYSHEHLPITHTSKNSSQMVVSLPQGFYPPIPPTKPMLYPFQREHVATTETNRYYSDWQPIIPQIPLEQIGSTVRQYIPYDRNLGDSNYHSNHRYDAVLFGPWQPVSPLLSDALPNVYYNGEENFEESNVTPAQDRNYVRIGNKKTISNAQRQNILNDPKNKTINLKVMERNTSEISTDIDEEILLPETLSHTTTSSNIWPKDFHSTVEETEPDEEENTYSNESRDTLPEVPVNITRMGVPFENTNSTDNSSICVPLTVQAQKSATETVEFERIYCFPLPALENQTNFNIVNKSIDIGNTLDHSILNESKVIYSDGTLVKFYYYLSIFTFWLGLQ